MATAIEAKLIGPQERSGLHGLTHRRATDAPGTDADEKLTSGCKSDAVVELYDHGLPTFNPAGKRR